MAELWVALQDGSRTCLERMKVASYLWKQEGIRKERWSLLLKWALEEVCKAYNRRAKSHPPNEVRCQLWQLLSVMLESVAISDVELWEGDASPSVHFFQSVCDVLNEVSKSDSDASGVQTVQPVLKCLHSILGAPILPPTLHKFEIVVSLLQAALDLAVFALTSTSTTCCLLTSVFQLLEQLLRYFVFLQGSQGNPKKVFMSICQQLLPSLLKVKHHLLRWSTVSRESSDSLCCDRVNSELKNLLLVIFSRDHLSEFTSAVAISDATSSAKKRSATSYVRVLFETLTKMAAAASGEEESKDQLAVVEGVPELYASFLHQNRQEEMVSKVVEFKFLNKLLNIMGMEEVYKPATTSADSAAAMETSDIEKLELGRILRNLTKDEKSREIASNDQRVPKALSECLELIWKFDVYQVAEDMNSGGEQFATLQRLVLKIIRGLDYSCMLESYDCLATMMRLNHKLLEPWLPSLWLLLILTHRQMSKDSLGQECVTIFARLRQLPQLLTNLFEALDLFAEIPDLSISTFPTFSPSTELLLGDCLSKLPPGQSAEILQLLLSRLINFVANLEAGAPLDSTLPSLERAVDISRLVLSHLPSDFWNGKLKDEALRLLQSLINDGVHSLLKACPMKGFHPRLTSISLLLSSECTDLLAHICYLSPSLLHHQRPLKMIWNEILGVPVPEQWSDVSSTVKFDSLGRHLLRKLALLELRFYRNESSELQQQLLAFIINNTAVSEGTPAVDATWNGQLLDLTDENEQVGYWRLLFSQLPFVYHILSKGQLTTIAEEMIKAALLAEGGKQEEEGHRESIGITVAQLVSVFLESEGFVEMTVLQEQLLGNFVLHLSSLMRQSLSKPLRKAVKSCVLTESPNHGTQKENLTTILCEVLRHGLEILHDPPPEENAVASFDNLNVSVSLINQMIRNFQLCSLSQVVLLQTLNVFTVLHITITQQMYNVERQREAAAPLEDLTYILSWLVHSLARVREMETKLSHGSKKKRKKMKKLLTSDETEAELANMMTFENVLNHFTLYIYEHMTLIQILDLPSSLLASTMVAMEISLNTILKVGEYPSELLEKVVTDLQRKPKDDSWRPSTSAASKCMYIIANVSCKMLSECQGDKADSKIADLLEHTVTAIEKFIARKKRKKQLSSAIAPLEVVQEHPTLVSTLALLLHHRPGLVSARHVEIVSLLCGVTKEARLASLFKNCYANYEMFCGMLDVLSLPAAIARSSYSTFTSENSEDVQEMIVEKDEERVQTDILRLKSPLLLSWKRLQNLLEYTFSEALLLKNHENYHLLHFLEHCRVVKTSGRLMEEKNNVDMFSMLCAQLSRTTSTLLAAASNEELQVIMEQLLSVKDLYPTPSVLVFLFSWCTIVSLKLPQEKKSLIRKFLQRVLLVCQSIVVQHSSDVFTISLIVQLVAQLLSIPTSIGLDHTSVLLALELCVFTLKQETESGASILVTASLVVAETELLMAVVRQHISVANSAPTPIVTAVNKLLGVVVKIGRAVATLEVNPLSNGHSPALLEACVNSAAKVSRLMELLSQKVSYTKFALYNVHVFLTSSQAQAAAIHTDVKGALLPGIFNLLKLCTPNDIAFIKASVDQATRDSFQTLLEEFQRFHKFGGRV